MDTTFQYDDDADTKHAVKMLELVSGEDEKVKVLVEKKLKKKPKEQ